MNILNNKYFFALLCAVSTYFSNQPILPETIATTTLLKYGGVAAVVAVGGRYIALAKEEITQFYQMRFRKIPSVEFCNDFSSNDIEAKNKNFQQEFVLKKEAEKSLFTKIKGMGSFRKEQQYQHQSFQAHGPNNSSDEKRNHWSQTNVHAQQARGFFPKVNNYHYYSDKGDFWKGATVGLFVGSFVIGPTYVDLVVKHKRD